MATSQTGNITVNLVTSGTTASNIRATSSVITAQGTNLSIVPMHVQYQKRYIESQKKFLFFLPEIPAYLPNVGQKVLIHHLDVPVSSALEAFFRDKSTNVAVGTFVRLVYMTNAATVAARDGFTYALEIAYDDNQLGYIAGNCNGAIEYDTSPLTYDILKPIESNVIVTEKVPYDGSEGDNYLIGSTTGATQSRADIAPMLFVDRGDSNTVFSNLYKSFNLPITDNELAEFTQTTLGFWTDSTSGNLYHDGKKGYWTAGPPYDMIHPVTGYTGQFFGTVYEDLAQTKILVMEIPQAQYGEIVDGKTLKIKVPSSNSTYYTLYGAYKKNTTEYEAGLMDNYMSEHDYSASYFGNPPQLSSTAYESNIVLLFCDAIAQPYNDGIGGLWSTGHDEVMDGEKVYNTLSTTKKIFYNFYQDRAVGIAYLDRGFVVITDPTIVTAAYNLFTASSHANVDVAENIIVNYDGMNIDWDNSQFLFKTSFLTTGSTVVAEYLSYNTEKSMNVVCLASANEFFRTTNDTAKVLTNSTDQDYAEFKNPISGNLYPIVITEIGLHDAQGNLLAIVKPTEPIKKYWYDVVSFNIKIRL